MLYESNQNVKDAEDVNEWQERKHFRDMQQIESDMKAAKK